MLNVDERLKDGCQRSLEEDLEKREWGIHQDNFIITLVQLLKNGPLKVGQRKREKIVGLIGTAKGLQIETGTEMIEIVKDMIGINHIGDLDRIVTDMIIEATEEHTTIETLSVAGMTEEWMTAEMTAEGKWY